jgi:hypothetical protein
MTTTTPTRANRPLRARPVEITSSGSAAPAPTRSLRRALAAALAATLAVLVAAEVAVRLVEDRLPPRSGWISDEYPQKIDQMDALAAGGGVDVVLLGSSVVDVSVDPAGLAGAAGRRGAYNAGLIGATPEIVEAWAHVVSTLRPDVAVVAVSSRDLNGNGAGMRSSTELFRRSAGGRRLLGTQSTADRIEWWLDDHVALLRHRQSLRRPLEALTSYDPPDRNSTRLTRLGFETHLAASTYRSDETTSAFFRREPLRDWAVTDDQRGALARLATSLEDQGIRVILLDVPVTDDYVSLHPEGAADVAEYAAAIDALAVDADAEVLRPGIWPEELFSDPLHLNGAGVERLTAELRAYLAAGR